MNDQHPDAPLRWSLRDRAVAVVFVLAVVTMVAMPLSRFFDDEPGRFGWHMFSLGRAVPEYTVVPAAGEPFEVEPGDYLAGLRSDFSLEGLPRHLCTVIPNAITIVVSEGGRKENLPCP